MMDPRTKRKDYFDLFRCYPENRMISEALKRRAKRTAALRKKSGVRAPGSPDALEARYTRDLRALSRELAEAARKALGGPTKRARAAERRDVDPGPFEGVDWGVLRARLIKLADRRARRIVDAHGRALVDWTAEDLGRVIRVDIAAESPAVLAALEAWTAENARLCTSIAERLHGDLRDLVMEATSSGMRADTLAARIAERFDVSHSRATLIAQDQTLKAAASFTRIRHADAGIDSYVWSSSRDEKVRPMHAALEGRIFSWTDPPVTNRRGDRNHPGGDIRCRCVPVPVLTAGVTTS